MLKNAENTNTANPLINVRSVFFNFMRFSYGICIKAHSISFEIFFFHPKKLDRKLR